MRPKLALILMTSFIFMNSKKNYVFEHSKMISSISQIYLTYMNNLHPLGQLLLYRTRVQFIGVGAVN